MRNNKNTESTGKIITTLERMEGLELLAKLEESQKLFMVRNLNKEVFDNPEDREILQDFIAGIDRLNQILL